MGINVFALVTSHASNGINYVSVVGCRVFGFEAIVDVWFESVYIAYVGLYGGLDFMPHL